MNVEKDSLLIRELLQIQDELNIVIQITQQQWNLITDLKTFLSSLQFRSEKLGVRNDVESLVDQPTPAVPYSYIPEPANPKYRQYSSSAVADPISQLLENLGRELSDLRDLQSNASTLVHRTVQLVNLRVEDLGKAILVLTIVIIIFLPLSFATSYSGMNTSDMRNMSSGQGVYWAVAACLTVLVFGVAMFFAFYDAAIIEKFDIWKSNHQRNQRLTEAARNTFRTEPHLKKR
ncbi:MAG: hypothetical protein M1827_003700 [Pycnora praestabilis]|nr:MAG: hypothetical protein M1827_003700 [Pycnora praestabilis]